MKIFEWTAHDSGGDWGAQTARGSAAQLEAGLEDLYSLSPMQQGMLFHVLSAPEDRLYLDQTLCTVLGELEEEPFRRAWQLVIDRHPALRTAFVWQGLDRPRQMVYDRVPASFETLDWRSLSPKVQKAQLEAFLREDRQRGFDLERPPLTRVHVIRMGDRSYRMLWTVYHLIVDAWSSTIVLDEVVRSYEALRRGEQPVLPPVRPFHEFIRWGARRSAESSTRFWADLMAGFDRPTPVSEGEDRHSMRGMGSGHRHERLELSQERTRALKQMGRHRQLTLSTLVQGAWGLLLSYRSERDDVVFGATVSGRSIDLPGASEIVGPMINTLPHRLRIDHDRPLEEWLHDLQRRQLEVREHEQTPLQTIHAASEIDSGTPLFDSIVVFLNIADISRQDTGSFYLQDLRYIGRPHPPVTLNVLPGRHLELEMVYEMRRLRWSEVRRWLEQLDALLKAMVERPEATLGELLATLRAVEEERRTSQRRRRRDSNSGILRITRPVAVKIPDPER